jgi:hypothetical protein
MRQGERIENRYKLNSIVSNIFTIAGALSGDG